MLSDLKYAVRQLAKSPGFTVVALATLALSLGANTAIFTFVNAVLLQPLPYSTADRIVTLAEVVPNGGHNSISTLNFLDWQKQNKVFAYMAAVNQGSVSLTGVDEPAQLPGYRVSAHHFDILGMRAALGRTFADGEDEPGRDHVAILSDAMWRSRFGADPQVIGRSITLDGEAHTIIGVLPANPQIDRGHARIWLPLAFSPSNRTRNFHWFNAIALLKPGVTLTQARAQMDAIGARIARDYPDTNQGWGIAVDRLADTTVSLQLKQSLVVLFAAVGMVLAIACANLANLSLMRVVGREREIAIRLALGAGRRALLRQFLTESLTLSVAGGAIGLAVGQLALTALKAIIPSDSLPSAANVHLDGWVLLFSFLLSVLTGLLIGLLPALQAARPSLTNSLKQGGLGSSAGGSSAAVRNTLMVAEIALAFVLLTAGGLLIRNLDRLSHFDVGFKSDNVITFGLPISQKRLPDPDALRSYLAQLTERLRALPGVTDVALASVLPLEGWGYGMPFRIAGQDADDPAHRNPCFFKMVSASYFSTLGMHLNQGRFLADSDAPGHAPVAVINATMARKYFSGVNPVGQRILGRQVIPGSPQLGDEIPWEVVGVVADERVVGLDNHTLSPGMYVSIAQSPIYKPSLLLRSSIEPTLLQEAAKKAVHEINRDQILTSPKMLEAIKAESLGDDRFRAILLGAFAGTSLLLAAIGIYGVISYSIVQRTRELGIRVALGATRGRILGMVLGRGLILAGVGLGLGLGGALGLTQLLTSLVLGVGGYDPLTLAVVASLLGFVALVACALPAWRAARIDPIIALRTD